MYMSVVASSTGVSVYPELAGARVLISGLASSGGVDIARAFADHKVRLVIQTPECSPEMTALAAVLAESAAEVTLFNDPISSADDAVRFVQTSAQTYGGLDAVVNLVPLVPGEVANGASLADVEAFVSDKLLPAALMTRVSANRMRLTLTDGVILNVLCVAPGRSDHNAAVADVAYATLAAMTRGEAKEWGEKGVRINAVGPRTSAATSGSASGASETDIAALALYLASKKGRGLSGHVFDAEGVAARRC